MDRSEANAEAVRDFVGKILDQLLVQFEAADDRLPLPADPTVPSVVIPDFPRCQDDLLCDFETVIEGSANSTHHGYFGHMETILTTSHFRGDRGEVASKLDIFVSLPTYRDSR